MFSLIHLWMKFQLMTWIQLMILHVHVSQYSLFCIGSLLWNSLKHVWDTYNFRSNEDYVWHKFFSIMHVVIHDCD